MKLVFLFPFLMVASAFSETIVSFKYDLSKSERNRVVSAASKNDIEALPVHSVSAFRYTKPKLATVVFGPYGIKEHTLIFKAVDCQKKYGLLWRCAEGIEYKFVYFDEIHDALRVGGNIGYKLARKIVDFSKTTDCYPRNWPNRFEIDREGLQFSESLEENILNEEYSLLAAGCTLTVRIKNDLISLVNISYSLN